MERNDLILFASELIGVIAVTLLLTLSPRFRQQRVLTFRYPRREGIVALSLFAVTLVTAILFFTVPG